MAVGTVRPSDQPTAATGAAGSAAAWWSPDGATWERLPGPDDAGVLTAACVAGDHVWAIGRGADGTALVWREPIGGGPFERAALEPPATGWVPSGCDADGATGGVLLAGLAPDPAAAASPSAAEVVGGVTPVGQAWLVAIGPDGAVQRRPGPAAAFVGGVASDRRGHGGRVAAAGAGPPVDRRRPGRLDGRRQRGLERRHLACLAGDRPAPGSGDGRVGTPRARGRRMAGQPAGGRLARRRRLRAAPIRLRARPHRGDPDADATPRPCHAGGAAGPGLRSPRWWC